MELQPQCSNDLQYGGEFRVTRRRQSLIKTFTPEAGFARHLGHVMNRLDYPDRYMDPEAYTIFARHLFNEQNRYLETIGLAKKN